MSGRLARAFVTVIPLIVVRALPAAVSPVLGSAGFECSSDDCGDQISALEFASGGYTPPFFANTPDGLREFKPNLFYIEVPRDTRVAGGGDIGFAVPFVVALNDIDTGGAYDTCYNDKNEIVFDGDGAAQSCDTATVIRIYPPAYATTVGCGSAGNAFAQLEIEAAPSPDRIAEVRGVFNCEFLTDGPEPLCSRGEERCCDRLDDQVLEIDFSMLFEDRPGGPLLDQSCAVPGTWKVEIDTSASAGFARAYIDDAFRIRYPELSQSLEGTTVATLASNDINVFRIAAYQDDRSFFLGDRNPGCETESFLRVWSPFVNLTNPVLAGPGQPRVSGSLLDTYDALLFANVSGGWLTSFDVGFQSLKIEFIDGAPTPNPLNTFIAPGLPSPVVLDGTNFSDVAGQSLLTFDRLGVNFEQGEESRRSVSRAILPFTFLSDEPYPEDAPLFPSDDGVGVPGYPFPVSEVDAAGIWGVLFRLPTDPVINSSDEFGGRITTIAIRSQDNPLTDATNSGRQDFAELPTFANTHKLFFPIDTEARLACEEQAGSITKGNIADLESLQEQFVTGQKPAVSQTARGIGAPVDKVVCVEQEIRVTNPRNAQGSIRTPVEDEFAGILGIVPGTLDQPGGNDVRLIDILECDGLVCQNCPRDISCPSPREVRTVNCEEVSFPDLPPGGLGSSFRFLLRDVEGNATLKPGEEAFVKYALAVSVENDGLPTFLTGRGELGTRARWQDETTPDTVRPGILPPDPDPFNDKNGGNIGRFGPPDGGSGEEDGPGGTSTSTNGTDAPDPTLATVRSLRIVTDQEGETQLELITGTEFNTAGFEVIERTNGEWRLLSPFFRAHPDRPASVYVAPLLEDPLPNRQLMVREYELTGAVRDHGPFDVALEVVDALEPVREATSYERPDLPWSDAPPSFATTAVVQSGSRAQATIWSEGVYRIKYEALAQVLSASAAELAAAASEGMLRATLDGRALPYEPGAAGLTFWTERPGTEELDAGVVVFEFGRGAQVRSLGTERGTGPSASYFTRTIRFEEDLLPAPGTGGTRNEKLWMWRFLVGGSDTDGSAHFDFDAPHLADGAATLSVELRGGSKSDLYPDHELVFLLNGEEIHRSTFYGFDVRKERFAVPSGMLEESGNRLEIRSVLRPNIPFSVVWLDGFELSFPSSYDTDGRYARVRGEGQGAITLSGFSEGTPHVWEITGGLPTVVENTTWTDGQLRFDTGFREAEYIAFSEPLTVSGLRALGGAGLVEETFRAEYVIVAHRSLVESAQTLADYRSEQGLSTRVFDVQELYDAYTAGAARGEALSLFLRDAYQRWDVPPRYVLIVGDGTFDPRGRLGFSDNLVTPNMFTSTNGTFASDSPLGELGVETGYSVAVGRLPAHTPEEVLAYVSKVRVFEAVTEPRLQDLTFVLADNPDSGGDFDRSLELALDAFGQGLEATGTLVEPSDLDYARDQLFAAIDSGTRYLHFIGHGGLDGLAGERVLAQEDVASLGNEDTPFVLLAAACLLGRFDVPGLRVLSEDLLLTPSVGAAAVFASAGLEENEKSTALTRVVGEVLGAKRHRRLGGVVAEASVLARGAGASNTSLRLHTLLGDPALVVAPGGAEWLPYERRKAPAAFVPPAPEVPEPIADETSGDLPATPGAFAGPEDSCAAASSPFWFFFGLSFLRRRRPRA